MRAAGSNAASARRRAVFGGLAAFAILGLGEAVFAFVSFLFSLGAGLCDNCTAGDRHSLPLESDVVAAIGLLAVSGLASMLLGGVAGDRRWDLAWPARAGLVAAAVALSLGALRLGLALDSVAEGILLLAVAGVCWGALIRVVVHRTAAGDESVAGTGRPATR